MKLDKEIKKALEIEDNDEMLEEKCQNKDIDELWDIISNNIMKYAYITLPSKKLAAKRMQSKESSVCTSIQKDLRKLGKICHKCAERVEQAISEEDQWQFNTE